jgi:hypothetical protein
MKEYELRLLDGEFGSRFAFNQYNELEHIGSRFVLSLKIVHARLMVESIPSKEPALPRHFQGLHVA